MSTKARSLLRAPHTFTIPISNVDQRERNSNCRFSPRAKADGLRDRAKLITWSITLGFCYSLDPDDAELKGLRDTLDNQYSH